MKLSIEIGICRMQEYYEIYLYTLYKKKWLEENGYKFSKKSYIEFLNILGLEYGIEKWKKGKNIYLKKYKDILDLNFERILEYIYYIFYPSYQILMKEKIVFKTKVYLFKINNYWCLYENVCPELREFLNPLDTEYKYLVYNNTAGKYNYYNKNVKNEIYIFETAYLNNDDKTLLEIKNILI